MLVRTLYNTPRQDLHPASAAHTAASLKNHQLHIRTSHVRLREAEVPSRHRRRRSAGLLAAINFLRREGPVQYEVDLVEAGEDYGLLDAAGLEKQRSWMIHLSTHGLAALR